MKKKFKDRFLFALAMAIGASLINIAHKKIGGVLAGGNYSAPHSWQEIFEMAPSLIVFFFVVLIGGYVFLYYRGK